MSVCLFVYVSYTTNISFKPVEAHEQLYEYEGSDNDDDIKAGKIPLVFLPFIITHFINIQSINQLNLFYSPFSFTKGWALILYIIFIIYFIIHYYFYIITIAGIPQ